MWTSEATVIKPSVGSLDAVRSAVLLACNKCKSENGSFLQTVPS